MLDKYKKLSIAAKASFWAMFANLIQKGISVLCTPVFTRILTTEEFADYTLYQSWHSIFIIFATLNVFNYAVYTAMVKFENDRDGFITSAQSLVTCLTFACFLIYALLHLAFGEILGFPLYIVLLMFLELIFVAAFNLWCGKERYEFRYKLMTCLSLLIGILGPFAGFIFIKIIPYKGYGRIYGVLLVNIIVGLLVYFYNIQKSKTFYVKKYWLFVFSYCVPLIPHFLSSQIISQIDRLMINDMVGKSEAGIYSLAYSVSMLMLILNDAILKGLTPWTYNAIKENNQNKIASVVNSTIVLVALANAMLAFFAPEAIAIFAPEEYYAAIYVIPAVSASAYFMFLFNVFANVEYYYSETKLVACASVSAAVVNVILNLVLIPHFGYIAAGYTTLVSYILYALGHYVFMKKTLEKHNKGRAIYDGKVVLSISGVFTIGMISIVFLYKYSFLRWGLGTLILLLAFKKVYDLLKSTEKI